MADLHERIRSAIEHRLTLAETAGGGVWTVEPVCRMLKGCRCLTCEEDEPYGWAVHEIGGYGEDPSPIVSREVAQHIAVNSPDVIIRACRADLERLSEHARVEPDRKHLSPTCSKEWDDGDGYWEPWPCPEVLRLAAVYDIEVTNE